MQATHQECKPMVKIDNLSHEEADIKLLNLEKAAAILGMKPSQLRHIVATGKIDYYQAGFHFPIRFTHKMLDDHIKENTCRGQKTGNHDPARVVVDPALKRAVENSGAGHSET
jgi:hypothetical protein